MVKVYLSRFKSKLHIVAARRVLNFCDHWSASSWRQVGQFFFKVHGMRLSRPSIWRLGKVCTTTTTARGEREKFKKNNQDEFPPFCEAKFVPIYSHFRPLSGSCAHCRRTHPWAPLKMWRRAIHKLLNANSVLS